ncbi:hypothetical protein [[Eubacterium] cellulosolvens]
MADLIELGELLWAITPFIIGMIAIAAIPSKDRIINRKVKKYHVEVLIVVYLIAFFILAIGMYYLISVFSSDPENQNINIFNGIFLEIIALGIMALNYRNFSIFSNLDLETDQSGRVSRDDVIEVTEVSPIDPYSEPLPEGAAKYEKEPVEPELLKCPNCSNTITIMVNKRPLKIQCPHCGIEGIIK